MLVWSKWTVFCNFLLKVSKKRDVQLVYYHQVVLHQMKNLNVSAILSGFSCSLTSEFSKYLSICLEESVFTVYSAAMSVLFSSFDMIKIKIKVKIKTKYFPLVFFCCFHVKPLFISRAE